jgi:hypothetical protein
MPVRVAAGIRKQFVSLTSRLMVIESLIVGSPLSLLCAPTVAFHCAASANPSASALKTIVSAIIVTAWFLCFFIFVFPFEEYALHKDLSRLPSANSTCL